MSPQQRMMSESSQAPKPWEAGCMSCCDDFGLCMDVCCCYPCARSRIHTAATLGTPDNCAGGMCCLMWVSQLLPGLGWACRACLNCGMRTSIRDKYDIDGSGPGDCFVSCCFESCGACQEHRQLAREGVDPGYTCCQPSITYNHHPKVPKGVQPGYNYQNLQKGRGQAPKK